MSDDYIRWHTLSDGEQENLRKSVCERLLAFPEVAKRFTLTKEKYGRKAVHKLESKHKDSSVTVVIHESEKDWPEKAGVYIKRSDGFGNGQTQTIRYHLKSDESFNVEKAASRVVQLDQVSRDHSTRRREDNARGKHKDDLKKLLFKEIEAALADEPWSVNDFYDSVRIYPEGEGYQPAINVAVKSGYEPSCKVEFDLSGEPKANSKLLKGMTKALGLVMGVIEGETFRSAFEDKPVSLLT